MSSIGPGHVENMVPKSQAAARLQEGAGHQVIRRGLLRPWSSLTWGWGISLA